jgi:serine/threonine protein phosphatase 1
VWRRLTANLHLASDFAPIPELAHTSWIKVGMPERTIAIGDIHGCADAFERLLDEIEPTTDDLLVPLGDFVDRGPNSRRVLDLLLDLEDRCQLVPIIGNHEIMMLQALNDLSSLRFWLECGGMATVESYGGDLDDVPETHLDFLQRCCRFVETQEHMFVHANYDPEVPLESQPDQLLFWEHVIRTLPSPHRSGKTAVVGHTPQKTGEILNLDYLLCIDTYCCGDGWLTALDVQQGTTWQTNERGEFRQGSLGSSSGG